MNREGDKATSISPHNISLSSHDAGLGDYGHSEALFKSSGISQLLSPVPTSTPSPTVDPQALRSGLGIEGRNTGIPSLKPLGDRRGRGAMPTSNLPSLTTTISDKKSLAVMETHDGRHPTSPIVKVSSFSRGDSPSREYDDNEQRSSQQSRTALSSGHLSPAREHSFVFPQEHETRDTGGHRRTISVPPSISRAGDGSWNDNPLTGQGGLDPTVRNDTYVPSIKDIMAQRERDEKNADVEQWLYLSEPSSDIEDRGRLGSKARGNNIFFKSRRRAKSTGDSFFRPKGALFSRGGRRDGKDTTIPGPGVLINEDSDLEDEEEEEYFSDSSPSIPESPPARVGIDDASGMDGGYMSPVHTLENSEANPPAVQPSGAKPWDDSYTSSHFDGIAQQPTSSNAAIMRFLKRSDNLDTASRVATWGTRGLSDSDSASIHLRIDSARNSVPKKKNSIRRNSLLEHAKGLLPKRSNSSAKRKQAEQRQNSTDYLEASPSEERAWAPPKSSSIPQRKPSFTRASRNHTNTSGAMAAMAGQIAAVGRGGGVGVEVSSPISPSTPWSPLRRHSHSRGELPTNIRAHGTLFDLITSHGGPPVPTLASPPLDKPSDSRTSIKSPNESFDSYGEPNNGDGENKGITMEFPFRAHIIVPTLEGFRSHIQQLNSRLEPALVERIAHEQIRRYQKLLELKVKHSEDVSKNKCAAGKYCFSQGGEASVSYGHVPDLLEPAHSQFQVPGFEITDKELASFGDGAISPALFPPGVPLPPVKRLPAEFECFLCFKVKKFLKPSDWTKHVHEDIQPFTCTFPACTEPKSFKRKADWVRHESERHRHLEWWTCSMPDCTHTCFRKDNFVQHLVREHKMPEPKVKLTKSRKTTTKLDGQTTPTEHIDVPSNAEALGQVSKLVETCRHVTEKKPTDEACRFCGNVCNSWKKLTVHMARHMEQIALPVLQLARSVSEAAMLDSGNREDNSPHPQNNLWVTTGADTGPNGHYYSPPVETSGERVPTPAVYGTDTLLTEAFGVPDSRVLPNGESNNDNPSLSPAALLAYQEQQQHGITSNRSYSLSPFSQDSHGQQYTTTLSAATYPPPLFVPLPPDPRVDGRFSPETRGMTYTQDVADSTPLANTMSQGQQLFASPVDNGGQYTHPNDQNSMNYNNDSITDGIDYSITAPEVIGGGYAQHDSERHFG